MSQELKLEVAELLLAAPGADKALTSIDAQHSLTPLGHAVAWGYQGQVEAMLRKTRCGLRPLSFRNCLCRVTL